jgi:hypothetical protein
MLFFFPFTLNLSQSNGLWHKFIIESRPISTKMKAALSVFPGDKSAHLGSISTFLEEFALFW